MPRRLNILKKLEEPEAKIVILKIIIILIASIIGIRLFILQVIKNDYYQQVAAKEHYGVTALPARRGEIFIKDYASNENVRVATNITLDTLYADPTLITNPKLVADRIAPIIYNQDEARALDQDRIDTAHKRAKSKEEYDAIKPFTDEELYQNFYNDFLQQISEQVRSEIILSDTLPPETLKTIAALGLTGVEVTDKQVKAYPSKITDRGLIASRLSQYVDMTHAQLEQILEGKNRYVILKKKIKPEISAQIKKIMEDDKTKNFFGLGLQEEYYRYYPEQTLAANVMGFVTGQGTGSYGIESAFNTELQGKNGVFETQRDGSGRQITVGDSIIQPAVDGDSVVLTIDRAMQLTVEKMLAKAVTDYNADSGQVIVMDPKTGRVMAMADYPALIQTTMEQLWMRKKSVFPLMKFPSLFRLRESRILSGSTAISRLKTVIKSSAKNCLTVVTSIKDIPTGLAWKPSKIWQSALLTSRDPFLKPLPCQPPSMTRMSPPIPPLTTQVF